MFRNFHVLTLDADHRIHPRELAHTLFGADIRILGVRICTFYVLRRDDGELVLALERELEHLRE